MRKHIINIGMSVSLLGTIATPAFAAEATPTMDQPNNGFYEGPNPEWAVLHSTNMEGTAVHRQYHRDAVRMLSEWLEENRPERGTSSYENAQRLFYQDRNMLHRQFHTEPVSLEGLMNTGSTTSQLRFSPSTIALNTSVNIDTRTYVGRPSRRSIVAASEELNRVRLAQR
ncbi:MAG TPA: hypothetical protein VI873_03455 [Candidatus Peribacteraceae bacterium]|nr:hypothetical protein [Candidatus Peribacteraceae bacterium]